MTRPTSHGGGEAGPPIAGDPSSFLADADAAQSAVIDLLKVARAQQQQA